MLADCGSPPQTFTSFECAMNKASIAGLMNMFEVWLKLATDTREVGVHGFWFDVMAHVDCIEAQHVRCQFHGHVMKLDKCEVGIKSGTIVVPSKYIDGLSKCNCMFTDEAFL